MGQAKQKFNDPDVRPGIKKVAFGVMQLIFLGPIALLVIEVEWTAVIMSFLGLYLALVFNRYAFISLADRDDEILEIPYVIRVAYGGPGVVSVRLLPETVFDQAVGFYVSRLREDEITRRLEREKRRAIAVEKEEETR